MRDMMGVTILRQIAVLRLVIPWQQRSDGVASRRERCGYKTACAIFALSNSIGAGLLHAADEDHQSPQSTESEQVSAESLGADALESDEDTPLDPLSFEAFDERARAEASSRVESGPEPYMSLEGVTLKATNLSDRKAGVSDVNTASAGSRNESDE
jgi:hypothetical protein